MRKLSIIIPVYNEYKTLSAVLDRVRNVKLHDCDKEIIIVDDGSTDGTSDDLRGLHGQDDLIVEFLEKNYGKGWAVRQGMKKATGDIVLIQDADGEYDPSEYSMLIQPILDGDADVVYGSRFVTVFPRRALYFWHYIANVSLTFISNLLTGLNISDMEVGYKIFSRKAVDAILPHLTSNRFGIEPELTAQVAKHKLRLYEVGISYRGRTYAEGKKITWKDGLAAIWHIIRFNLFS